MTPPHDFIDALFPACVTVACIGAILALAIIGGIVALVS